MSAASVGEALGAAVDALRAAGVVDPRLDAEVLLAEASGLERAQLAAGPDAGLAPAAGRRFGELVRRRARREPVAYILGRRGFRRIELRVDRRVLIPRPETELLVELALELAPESVLDVGTGSGAVALAVADELPGCRVLATDTSAAALEVARDNARRLGLAERVEFLERTQGTEFDLVLANLPYVAEPDWPALQPEIAGWEPPEALLAGPDGLDAYRSLLPRTGGLSPHATQSAGSVGAPAVGLEVGEGQAAAVGEMLRDVGFEEIEVRLDLAGIERVVVGHR